MAKRIIAIGGTPGSGKTTLMLKVLDNFKGKLRTFSYKNLRGMHSKEDNLYILGVYDGSTFSGTDKLAMNVFPHFTSFLSKVPEAVVLFEGNRLFVPKLFDNHECDILVVRADSNLIEQRFVDRGSNQPQRFLKAVKTKTERIIAKYPSTILQNNNEEDLERNTQHILSLIHEQN